MSLRITKNLKLTGAAGAALAITAALSAPALAAGEETANVSYDCSGFTVPATYAVNQPPAKIVAGQVVKLGTTATYSLDAGTTAAAPVVLGPTTTQVGGKVTTAPGGKGVGLNLTIARTALANNGDGSTTAPASGKTLLEATKAGSYTLKLGDIGKVHLQGYDASNAKTGFVDFPDGSTFTPCVNPAGTTTLKNGSNDPATVKVVKDKTTTAVTAGYSKAKQQATGTAKVKSHFGLKPTGKVKFTLKKGTHVITSITSKLNKKGVAKATFKNVKKAGKYSIVGKYSGNAALKSSKGTDTFSV
jgi:hypothetical protein